MTVFGSNSAERLTTVILATDFSDASEKAGRYASALARRMQSELVVAHAFFLEQAALEAETFRHLMSQQRIHLQQELNQVAGEMSSGRGAAEAILIERDPRIAIPELAEQRKPSIIVMGTHGGGSVERFVIGSTAEGILRHTRLPALSVGPKTPPLLAEALEIKRVLFVTNNAAGAAETAQLAVDVASAFGAALDVLNVIHPKSVENTLNEPHELYARHDETEAALPGHAHDHVEIRTYVVVKIWDERRLVVPLSYFIETPFQNWTRNTSDLMGTAFLYVDYSIPVEPLREELKRVVAETPLWDGRVCGLQVTNLSERTMELRCLVSSPSSGQNFDLRCLVRERMIAYIRDHYPWALPTLRVQAEAKPPSITPPAPPTHVAGNAC